MKDATCIVGVGETKYSRSSGRTDESLAVEAIDNALADAGLARSDVDGLIAYYRTVPMEDVIVALGDDVPFTATTHMGGAASNEALQKASLALAGGAATTIVVYTARNGSSGTRVGDRVLGRSPGRQFRQELEHPYGWVTPAQWFAMICRRHMHEYGTTERHLGAVAVTMREHAQLNERAVTYGRPMTMETYLASPMLADPYRKADCCLESDGGCAIVLTTPDRARNLRRPMVHVAGAAEGRARTPDDIVGRPDWLETGTRRAASAAFRMAGVLPADMDAAMIYDCFTFELLHQLEEAGFCGLGEGGPFVESGAIKIGGSLPVNTHGGLLAEAHMSGLNHIVEATRQLRGEAGARQLVDPKWIAVSGWGGTGDASFSVLRGHRA